MLSAIVILMVMFMEVKSQGGDLPNNYTDLYHNQSEVNLLKPCRLMGPSYMIATTLSSSEILLTWPPSSPENCYLSLSASCVVRSEKETKFCYSKTNMGNYDNCIVGDLSPNTEYTCSIQSSVGNVGRQLLERATTNSNPELDGIKVLRSTADMFNEVKTVWIPVEIPDRYVIDYYVIEGKLRFEKGRTKDVGYRVRCSDQTCSNYCDAASGECSYSYIDPSDDNIIAVSNYVVKARKKITSSLPNSGSPVVLNATIDIFNDITVVWTPVVNVPDGSVIDYYVINGNVACDRYRANSITETATCSDATCDNICNVTKGECTYRFTYSSRNHGNVNKLEDFTVSPRKTKSYRKPPYEYHRGAASGVTSSVYMLMSGFIATVIYHY